MADSDDNKDNDRNHGLSGWAIFILVIAILIIAAILIFIFYVRRRNRRAASTPYPSPAPGGIVGWINDRIAALKRGRFRSGAGYEPSGSGLGQGAARGAGHALDPDEAWDVRVGNEAIYDDQELGLREPSGYEGAGYYGASGGGSERERDLNRRYGEDTQLGRKPQNPFGDDAVASLRSVSPRPLDVAAAAKASQSGDGSGSADSSPTAERRSVFRENM